MQLKVISTDAPLSHRPSLSNPGSVAGALSFFDPPAHDESLYSCCARFHKSSGHARARVTSTAMFGHHGAALRPDFQAGMSHFARATGGLVPATEETLRERTVLRSHMPFMDAAERRKSLEIMNKHPGSGIPLRARAGMGWNGITPVHELRLCPSCAIEQRERHGFAYWETTKQQPGVWACVRHNMLLEKIVPRGRKIGWLCADGAATEPLPLSDPVQSELLPLLLRIAQCTRWIGEQHVIHRGALISMVRTRLYEAGHLRSEIVASPSELTTLEREVFAGLGRASIPHYSLFRSEWIRSAMRNPYSSHPTKWAALLAVVPGVDSVTLSQGMRDAIDRLPQEGLFDRASTLLHSRAPRSLYHALAAPVSMAAAAQAAGVRTGEVSRWLYRDKALEMLWRTAKTQALCDQAKSLIQAAISANPTLGRYHITKLCSKAVWALAKYEPDALERVLPPVYAKYDRQLRFSWD